MAPTPDSSLPPRERKKYVLDGEKLIFATNQHWLVVVEPLVTVAAVLVLTVYLDASMPGNARQVANIAWWAWFGTILRAAFLVWEWRHEWFIATNKRMLRVYGLINRQVAMMPLGKVTDMRFERTIPGRVLGYGTFVMESAGQVQALSRVDLIPHPEANYRAVVAEMFGVQDEVVEPPQEADEAVEGYDDYGDEDYDYDDDGGYDGGYGERGPDTVDDLPAVQVQDRYGDLRAWKDHFSDRYADDDAWRRHERDRQRYSPDDRDDGPIRHH